MENLKTLYWLVAGLYATYVAWSSGRLLLRYNLFCVAVGMVLLWPITLARAALWAGVDVVQSRKRHQANMDYWRKRMEELKSGHSES